jgi:uncharacterized protein YbjT (DUF2867 family)
LDSFDSQGEENVSKVFIEGGAGKVGRCLIPQLVAKGHQPVALHRNHDQAKELKEQGAQPVNGSLLELTADHAICN